MRNKHDAFETALDALNRQDLEIFFRELNFLQSCFESESGSDKSNITHFFQQLFTTAHIELNETGIAFYQAICRSLQGFDICAATLIGSLLKRRSTPRDKDFMRTVAYLANPETEEALNDNDPVLIIAKQNIRRVHRCAEYTRAFAPRLLERQTDCGRIVLDSLTTERIALIIFEDAAEDYEIPSLKQLADYYWWQCIHALNSNRLHDFHIAQAQLFRTMEHDLALNGKNYSGDRQGDFFTELHERVGVTEDNFMQPPFLNTVGKLAFDSLFRHHVEAANAIAEGVPAVDEKAQAERIKIMTANQMFFSFFPLPRDYTGSSRERINSAVSDSFNWIDDAYEKRAKQKIAARFAFLHYLKQQVDERSWDQEGRGFFGGKVPTTITQIRTVLANIPAEQPSDEAVQALFSHDAIREIYGKQEKTWNRSARTVNFYKKMVRLQQVVEDHGVTPWTHEERIAAAKYKFLLSIKHFVESQNQHWRLQGRSKNPMQLLRPFISCCMPGLGRKMPSGIRELSAKLAGEFPANYDPKMANRTADLFNQARMILLDKQSSKLTRSHTMQNTYNQWLKYNEDAELGLTEQMDIFMRTQA